MEDEIKPIENDYLDENGRFKEGNPGGGRKPETPEIKAIRKASKQIIAEYKEALAEALPYIQPVLIAKALEGDMTAIKELHDRTMDKAKQSTELSGEITEKRTLVIVKDNGEHN
jgi:hypothetical protein